MFVMKSLVFTQEGRQRLQAVVGPRRLHTAFPLSGAYFRPFRGERPHRSEHMPTSNTSWMALRKQWKLYSIKPTERKKKQKRCQSNSQNAAHVRPTGTSRLPSQQLWFRLMLIYSSHTKESGFDFSLQLHCRLLWRLRNCGD